MSHTSKVSGIKITNIEALTAAIADLNQQGIKCSLIANTKPRAFYDNQDGMGHADYVIRLDQASYDIGLYKQAEGSYEPRTDFWAGSVERILGVKAADPKKTDQAKLGKLFQTYGLCAAEEEARMRGLNCQRVPGENGAVKLLVTGFN